MSENPGAAFQPASSMDTTVLCSLYRAMLRIRLTEESLAAMIEHGEIGCPTHLYSGQEAVAAGVCSVLRPDDYVFGAHRSHGHYLAKGGGLRELVAEVLGKSTGCSRGRGGSMHLVAPEVGVLGTVPIVAATIPIAVGAALASKLRRDGRVTVSFFGDGATEEGTYHEAMNLAAVYRLPVILVCENNLYASHLHLLERRAKDNILDGAQAHGMPGMCVDGNDVVAVHDAAATAVERARDGNGPAFLECRTYRWRGHVGASLDADVGVRRRDELPQWRSKDPLLRARQQLLSGGVREQELTDIERELCREVEDAIQFARSSPFPDASELHDHLFHDSNDEANH